MESLIILLGFFVVMYFVMIRPQQKKQQEREKMLDALEVDDDVVTIGGLHGTVIALDEETADLEVTDDIVLRFRRSAIAEAVGKDFGGDSGGLLSSLMGGGTSAEDEAEDTTLS